MSVNSKMTAIADAIREKTGGTDALTLDGMAAAIPEVFSAGFGAGEAAQKALCFQATVLGSGTQYLSLEIPFEPDYFTVLAFNPYPTTVPYSAIALSADLGTFYTYIGIYVYIKTANALSPSRLTNENRRLFTYEDGVFTLNAGTQSNIPNIWRTGTYYKVCAVKRMLTDKDALAREINALPDDESGTVTLVGSRVSAAVTDDEWATLIAAKPNWTFTLA